MGVPGWEGPHKKIGGSAALPRHFHHAEGRLPMLAEYLPPVVNELRHAHAVNQVHGALLKLLGLPSPVRHFFTIS